MTIPPWSLKLRPGIDPGEVADRVTHAVWLALMAQPALERLYAGYWIAVRAVVREHLRQASVPGDRCDRVCPAFRGLHGCGDLEAFAGVVAADVVVRLEGVLAGRPVLPLLATHLPRAIERALATVRPRSCTPPVVHVDRGGVWIAG